MISLDIHTHGKFILQAGSDTAIQCTTKGCGKQVEKPYGHSHCRHHAQCVILDNRFEDVRLWEPFGCSTCKGLISEMERFDSEHADLDPIPRNPYFDMLRSWGMGFQRENSPVSNSDGSTTKMPFLADSRVKCMFFPGAGSHSFPPEIGEESEFLQDESNLIQSSGELITPDEEASLLLDTSTPMEVEEHRHPIQKPLASTSSQDSNTPPLAPPAAKDTTTSVDPSFQLLMNQMLAMQQEWRSASERQEKVNQSLQSMIASVQTVQTKKSDDEEEMEKIRLTLPADTPENRWRSCTSASLEDGRLLVGTDSWDIGRLDFHPSLSAFPFAFWRTSANYSLTAIPEETIILPAGQADGFVRDFAKDRSFIALPAGLMKKTKPVYRIQGVGNAPFAIKAFKTVEKAFEDQKLSGKPMKAPTPKESKVGACIVPDETPEFPGFKGFSELMIQDRYKINAPSAQLNERFGDLTNQLVLEELNARYALAQNMSTMHMIEILGQESKEPMLWSVLAKQFFPCLTKSLYDYFVAKRACRAHPLKGVNLSSDKQLLIETDIFSKELYSPSAVQRLSEAASRAGKNLHQRWGLSVPSTSTSQGNSTSQNRGVKRQAGSPLPLDADHSRRRIVVQRTKNQYRGRKNRGGTQSGGPSRAQQRPEGSQGYRNERFEQHARTGGQFQRNQPSRRLTQNQGQRNFGGASRGGRHQ